MQVFIDLNSRTAVSGIGSLSPVGTIELKSQDTLDLDIFFLSGGIVQDLTSGAAIKFGLVQTSNLTTLLVLCTSFTRMVDPTSGNVFYRGQPVFNTSQMVTALGTAHPSLACTAEIRYQQVDGEIVHCLNIPFQIDQTIIAETGSTPPTLSGTYPDESLIELKANRDQPSGYPSLDSGGKLLVAELPAGLELSTNKNQPSGYPGLNSGGLLTGTQIPVDAKTILLNGAGQLASAAILSALIAPFVTPASGIAASANLATANLVVDGLVRIPIAGYYTVQSITDSTHAVLENTGDPFNALAGVTILTGTPVLPGGLAPVTSSVPAGTMNASVWATGSPNTNKVDHAILADTATALVGGAVATLTDFETSTGVSIIHAATGVLNRLLAGTGISFDITTTPGAIILNVTGGGSGVSSLTDAETSTGQTLINASTGVLKRLVAGSGVTFDATTTPGAIIITASGGGSLTLVDEETSTGQTLLGATNGQVKRLIAGTGVTFDATTTPGGVIINTSGGLTLVDAETSTGDTLLGSVNGQVKRIIAGANVTLDTTTTPGAVIITAAGGGGGTPANCLVYLLTASNQTYTDGVQVVFNTAITDPGSLWDGGGNIAAPTTGLYLCSASFSLHYATSGVTEIGIYVNNIGSANKGLGTQISGVGGQSCDGTISGLIYLTAGDKICLGGNSNNGLNSGSLPDRWNSSSSPTGSTSTRGNTPCLGLFKVA